MMRDSLIVSDDDIEHFVSVYLSEVGIRKWVTTLHVYRKRNNRETWQVEININTKRELNSLVKVSEKTKVEIIKQLIGNEDLCEFQKAEVQLDIQLKDE